MAKLSDPITMLRGIGPAKAKLFQALNIFTLEDLICHFPRGYEDRTRMVPIAQMQVDEPACFRAVVMSTPRTAHIRKGLDLTRVSVADHSGRIQLTFFNTKFAAENLQYGKEYIFYGTVSGDYSGYGITNPIFEAADAPAVTTRRIMPIYPLTAGVNNGAMTKLIRQALALCDPPREVLPPELLKEYHILPAERAYTAIHDPETWEMAEQAKSALGDRFSPLEFHTFLLDLGPLPFSVIRTHFEQWLRQQTRRRSRKGRYGRSRHSFPHTLPILHWLPNSLAAHQGDFWNGCGCIRSDKDGRESPRVPESYKDPLWHQNSLR